MTNEKWYENRLWESQMEAQILEDTIAQLTAERDEWKADAERLAEDYWGVEGLATYCIHCNSSASFYANIPHDANCPITLHRELVAKYGQVVDK